MNMSRNFWVGAVTGFAAVVIAKSGLLKRAIPAPESTEEVQDVPVEEQQEKQ